MGLQTILSPIRFVAHITSKRLDQAVSQLVAGQAGRLSKRLVAEVARKALFAGVHLVVLPEGAVV